MQRGWILPHMAHMPWFNRINTENIMKIPEDLVSDKPFGTQAPSPHFVFYNLIITQAL